jgi:hypothetical protein
MKWPFFQDSASGSKKKRYDLLLIFAPRILGWWALRYTCKFSRQNPSQVLFCHLGDLYIIMMNANNQPANLPAIVGHQQQQDPRCEQSNIAHFTSTEVQGLLQVIEEILPVHGDRSGKMYHSPMLQTFPTANVQASPSR